MQCHPIAARACWVSLSRSLLRPIFFCQKSTFVFGILKNLQLSCPCQKQPLTNIHVRYFRSTKSGWPGNRLCDNRYLKPREKRYFLTIISGFVSLDLMAAMTACRCCLSNVSISPRSVESKRHQMPNPPVNETSTALLWRILEPGGTLCVSQILPPITVLRPMVILPKMVELA